LASTEPAYPQMPHLMEDGLLSLYEQTIFARLGTINEDGTVHITPIYFIYKDGQIVIATQVRSRKFRNIKRNNKVSILIDVTEPEYQGALVYGEAEFDYVDVIKKRVEIFMRFNSREDAQESAEWLSDKWECVIVRITPTRIVSFDYSQE
jgi:nitroimidazol reductase NimA-like FMN-containing flavoprotein (pyridoxamine 5'-phosphate oxidase superfamily)